MVNRRRAAYSGNRCLFRSDMKSGAADRTAVQEPDRSAERGRNYRRTAADRSRRCYCYYRGVRP